MSEAVAGRQEVQPPIAALVLHPVHGDEKDAFTVSLEEDVLSLISPDERLVMMLPREEAARHIRFNYDLFYGRTVSFVVVEGLKAHTFRCPLLELEQLLNWLPQKPKEQREEEVRQYGISLILLGAALLLFQEFFFWPWGLGLILLGCVCVYMPRPFMYGVNAAIMFTLSLLLMFPPKPLGIDAGENLETARVLCTGLGSLLIIWCIQQFSMLGSIHRLRVARTHRDAFNARQTSQASGVVRAIACGVGLLACFLAAHLAWLGVHVPKEGGLAHLPDWIIHGTLSFVLFLAAIVLWRRKSRAYFEAKVSAQFALVLIVFYLAGVVTQLANRLPIEPDVLRIGFFSLAEIYVYAPLVVTVLLFNHWYAQRVERELEDARE